VLASPEVGPDGTVGACRFSILCGNPMSREAICRRFVAISRCVRQPCMPRLRRDAFSCGVDDSLHVTLFMHINCNEIYLGKMEQIMVCSGFYLYTFTDI
jgi:hypothetical protein